MKGNKWCTSKLEVCSKLAKVLTKVLQTMKEGTSGALLKLKLCFSYKPKKAAVYKQLRLRVIERMAKPRSNSINHPT